VARMNSLTKVVYSIDRKSGFSIQIFKFFIGRWSTQA